VEIGRYTVKRALGRGAMGQVYLAWDPRLQRDVAIKLMNARMETDPEFIYRFEREADAVANLRHPNVLKVYDKDRYESEGATHCFIVMEYVEGEDLSTLINERVFVPFEQKLEIIIKICRALDHAHQKGVIHRDVKPSNVRITAEGDVCVLDFGLAKFKHAQPVSSQGVFGTPHYMSPEQTLSTRSVDKRSDLFSTALILYELITYKKPFPVDDLTDALAYMSAIRSVPHVPISNVLPECAPELVQMIDRALQKRPDDRFNTCGEFADALTGFLKTLPQREARLATEVDNLRKIVRRYAEECEVLPPEAVSVHLQSDPEPHLTHSGAIQIAPKDIQLDYGLNLFRSANLETKKTTLVKLLDSAGIAQGSVLKSSLTIARRKLKRPIARRTAIISLTPVLIGTLILVYFSRPQPETGRLELTVAPWASVDSVVNLKTAAEALKQKTQTPCNIELPPGKYLVSLSHPKFGTMKVPVEISSGQSNRVHQTFPGFNP